MGSLADQIRAEGGKVLHEGQTLRGAEAQAFRLALRAHVERRRASVQQLAADLAPLGLTGHLDLARCSDTPDGGVSLVFHPEAPQQ